MKEKLTETPSLMVAIVLSIITIPFLILGIWTGDERWELTALIPGLPAFVAWLAYGYGFL